MAGLTHIGADGTANRVDVGAKAETERTAIAEGFVRVDPAAAGLVEDEDGEAPREEDFDPKGRPRGPRDAGGNR